MPAFSLRFPAFIADFFYGPYYLYFLIVAVSSAPIMSDSISSTVEGEQVVHNPTLLQNIQPSSSSQASTLGMCSMTLSGETLISLGLNASSNEFKNAWILDSGATDHII